MKSRFEIWGICICLFCIFSCSLPINDDTKPTNSPSDEEEEDNTCNLPWNGDTDKFIISNKKGIQLDDPQKASGTAYLSTPFTEVRDTRWEFKIHLSFNPSINNYACFYLASSSEDLNSKPDGYFLQIGGEKDNVALYRQSGNKRYLLAAGREIMKDNNSPTLYIKVECDINGYWTFWTKPESETEYTKEKQVKDQTFQHSVCYGILCVYTSSRCKGFNFRHIQVSHGVETVTSPDQEPDQEPDNPNIPDVPELPDSVRSMLLFNEIMYHPSSGGAEYIELYNPSNETITVHSLCLGKLYETGEFMSKIILKHTDDSRNLVIPPKGYICFTKSISTLVQKHNVSADNLVEISKFPSLNDSGGILALITDEVKWRLIDKCRFNDGMHTITPIKNAIGVSLEKKSPDLDSTNKNWHSSGNKTGGTPGIKNSRE